MCPPACLHAGFPTSTYGGYQRNRGSRWGREDQAQHQWAVVTKCRLCIAHHHTSYPRGGSTGSDDIVYH